MHSPKALLLHFKRFIATQNQNAGPVVQNDDGTSGSPIKEMVLRKNKVNLCGHRMLPIICFASYSALSFLYFCQQVKILLEETLSISQYGDNSNQILPWKYHLRGVVHHIGDTAFSGHYTSCVKRIVKDTQGDSSNTTNPQDNEEEWVRFDDQVGTQTSVRYVLENESNQQNCYMALYERHELNDTDYYRDLCARLTFALEARKRAHRECRQEKRRLRRQLRDV